MKHQRGVTLVEALVAFVVMAFGMIAVLGLQANMRFNSDVAKQRSEAVRLGQQRIEHLRSFSVLAPVGGKLAYDDAVSVGSTDVVGYTTNTTYKVAQTVTAFTEPDYKVATVRIDWKDRYAGDQAVTLRSVINGADPALAGSLMLPASGSPNKTVGGRSEGIPFGAHDLGDGRSAFKPSANGTVAIVFNNLTGFVTSLCTVLSTTTTANLAVTDLSSCDGSIGYLLSGYVRFATGVAQPTAADSENPASLAKDLDLSLALVGDGYQAGLSPVCFDDSPATGLTAVTYYCVVYPKLASAKWSGRLTVAPLGWITGVLASQFRVCRYSADYDGSGVIANREHPLDYVDVPGNLATQNFLVIRGDHTCPTDTAVDLSAGNVVNSNTVEMTPTPTQTPVTPATTTTTS